jgi:hypothetical protein
MNSSSFDDAFYYENAGFENYEATTYEPGPWMMIGVCLYSLISVLVFLPLSVMLGKACRKMKHSKKSFSSMKKKNDSASTIGANMLGEQEDDDRQHDGRILVLDDLLIKKTAGSEEETDSISFEKVADLEKQVDPQKVRGFAN